MMDYQEFLTAKRAVVQPSGFDVAESDLNPALYPFQRACVRWALKLGKAALFQERGLGKTIQELEWATHVAARTGRPVLQLAPLAVAQQTLNEAARFGYRLRYAESGEQVGESGLYITNYDRLHLFDTTVFGGVVLDESSILKSYTGKTKQAILRGFARTPYKLAASATPAPNDHLELGNHAEFLDVMASNEMIARWFINDTMEAGNYRLKGHAEKDFWRWLTSWAVCLSKPRDLGDEYHLPGYDLPPLHLHEHLLKASENAYARAQADGRLLPDAAPSSTTLHTIKRESLTDRVAKAAEIVAALDADEPVIFWCDTNYEADALMAAFPDALEVRGDHPTSLKSLRLTAFTNQETRRIITKPDIAGMGLNWQHCARQLFVGISFSFEKFYQAIGRSHRYGQTRDVHADLIYAETEGNVLLTVKAKQAAFVTMQESMNEAMREHGLFRDSARLALVSSQGATPIYIPTWLTSKSA